MYMDNYNKGKTYLSLLEDSLKKKNRLLDHLLKLTQEQEELIKEEDIEDDKFDKIIEEKEPLIEKVTELNIGFEQVYDRIKEELVSNKDKYHEEIQSLQRLIQELTDKGVRLQALEKRNKVNIELYLKDKRNDIKNFKLSNKTVSNYYKNMANQNQEASYFFDKKN